MANSCGWDKTDSYGMKDITSGDLKKNLFNIAKKSDDHRTVVRVGRESCGFVEIGSGKPVFMAGPCCVTSDDDMHFIAEKVKMQGAHMLRGGAYKPLTFPHSDPSRKVEGLKILREVSDTYKLPVVTEVMDIRDIQVVAEYSDMLQIGARNMSNFPLLREVGKTQKPVLLKRHPGMSLRDWLGAAEYLLKEGNNQVVLCERGISVPHTHDPNARFILDVQAIPAAKLFTHLPVIADPSHSTFNRKLVCPIARAAIAAGADGILIDVSPTPENDPVDPLQALSHEQFGALAKQLMEVAMASVKDPMNEK